MPEYTVSWSGEIVEYASDEFTDEFEDSADAELAGESSAAEQGVDDADVYVELVPGNGAA